MTTYPAQIVFVESDLGHRWVGRLLRPSAAVDVQTGRPVREARYLPVYLIEQSLETGRCVATIQGGHRSGRRYRSFGSVAEAQRAAVRWAGRRFRIPSVQLNG